MVEGSVQASLWIRKDLKRMCEDEGLNFTEWVNDSLERYFSVSTLENLRKELSKARDKVHILEKREADMVDQGVRETAKEAIEDESLATLRSNYAVRMENELSGDPDLGWITSPANADRCKRCGKDPDQMLKELEVWYRGSQKN